jgi:hypothetical protein
MSGGTLPIATPVYYGGTFRKTAIVTRYMVKGSLTARVCISSEMVS